MDCQNARLLLYFVRTGELDPSEREVLDNHLAACPDCAAGALAESRLDAVLETAMPRVPFPAGLKERILKQLARARRPRPWPWVAAAVVLLAAAVTGFAILANGPVELNSTLIVAKADIKTSPEAVAWFSSRGIHMAAPPAFNFNLLDTIDIAQIQGRQVAKLTFLSRADNRAVHVYVLSSSQFNLPAQQVDEAVLNNNWPGEISIPSSTHNIQLRRYPSVPDFFYLVVYNGASLDQFLLEGI